MKKLFKLALLLISQWLLMSCASPSNKEVNSFKYDFNGLPINVKYYDLEKTTAFELISAFAGTSEREIRGYIQDEFNNRLGDIALRYSCNHLTSNSCYHLVSFSLPCSGSVDFAFIFDKELQKFIYQTSLNHFSEHCYSFRKNTKVKPVIKWQ